MKVLVSHDNYERFKRGELEKSDKNLSAMPPSLDMLVEVKSPDEDKDRIWHIEEDKQLLKVQVHNNGYNGQKVFCRRWEHALYEPKY